MTSVGSSTSGTIRPYGLDCSGFTDWTYKTAVGIPLYAGTHNQWDNSIAISESELLPGDLGFLKNSDGQGWNAYLYGDYQRKKSRIIIGEKRALCIAIKRTDTERRGTCLVKRLQELF